MMLNTNREARLLVMGITVIVTTIMIMTGEGEVVRYPVAGGG